MGDLKMEELSRDFKAMAIKERVDAVVDLAERWNALARQGFPFRISTLSYFSVEEGIAEAAEALGVELHEFKLQSGRFLYYFYYEGYEFDHSSEERLGRYAGRKRG